jgi:hypothetical protein
MGKDKDMEEDGYFSGYAKTILVIYIVMLSWFIYMRSFDLVP